MFNDIKIHVFIGTVDINELSSRFSPKRYHSGEVLNVLDHSACGLATRHRGPFEYYVTVLAL